MSAPAIVAGLKFIGAAMAAKTAIEGLKEGNLLKAVVGGVGAYFGATSLMSGGAASMAGTAEGAVSAAGTATGAAGQQAIKTAGAGLAEQAAATSTMQGMATGGAALETGLSNAASQLSGNAASSFGAGMADLGSFAAEQGIASGASMSIPSASSFMNDGLSAAAANGLGGATQAGSGLLNMGASMPQTGYQLGAQGSGIANGAMGAFDTLKGYGSQAMQWAKDNSMMASSMMQMGGGLLQGMGQQGRFDDEMAALEAARKRRQLTGDTSFLRSTRYNPNTGRFEQVA